MVFEQLFASEWLEKRPWFTFVLAFCYTIIGIGSAGLIFRKNPSMMAVAFISILLIPTLNRLLASEAKTELREKRFSLRALFKDHKDIIEIYFFIFMGIFCMFFLVSILSPSLLTERLFSTQLSVAGITGEAYTGSAFQPTIFTSLILNNLKVFIVCLILSFAYGAGAVLFLTWNAAVWGVVLGYILRQSAVISGQNPLAYFGIMILPILPHLITEAAAYLSAAIAGGVLSKAAIKEELFSDRFNRIMTDAFILTALGFGLVIIAAIIEASLF